MHCDIIRIRQKSARRLRLGDLGPIRLIQWELVKTKTKNSVIIAIGREI